MFGLTSRGDGPQKAAAAAVVLVALAV